MGWPQTVHDVVLHAVASWALAQLVLLYMKGAKKSVCKKLKKFVCGIFRQPNLFRQPVTNSTHNVVTHSGKVVHTNIIGVHYYYCSQNSSSDSSIN